MKRFALIAAAGFAALSCYGWWFYFGVGPAHGPGAELGILGAILAAIALSVAVRRRRDS